MASAMAMRRALRSFSTSPATASFASTLNSATTSTASTSYAPSSPSNPTASPSTPSSFTQRRAVPVLASTAPSSDVVLLAKLARLIMHSGLLARAHSHLDTMLSQLTLSTSTPPLPLLRQALLLCAPSVRIVQRRKGTKNLPTPQPLTEEQRTRQAWKWIVEASEKREAQEKVFGKRLAAEVLSVLGGQSEALKKKEARHTQGMMGRANVPR